MSVSVSPQVEAGDAATATNPQVHNAEYTTFAIVATLVLALFLQFAYIIAQHRQTSLMKSASSCPLVEEKSNNKSSKKSKKKKKINDSSIDTIEKIDDNIGGQTNINGRVGDQTTSTTADDNSPDSTNTTPRDHGEAEQPAASTTNSCSFLKKKKSWVFSGEDEEVVADENKQEAEKMNGVVVTAGSAVVVTAGSPPRVSSRSSEDSVQPWDGADDDEEEVAPADTTITPQEEMSQETIIITNNTVNNHVEERVKNDHEEIIISKEGLQLMEGGERNEKSTICGRKTEIIVDSAALPVINLSASTQNKVVLEENTDVKNAVENNHRDTIHGMVEQDKKNNNTLGCLDSSTNVPTVSPVSTDRAEHDHDHHMIMISPEKEEQSSIIKMNDLTLSKEDSRQLCQPLTPTSTIDMLVPDVLMMTSPEKSDPRDVSDLSGIVSPAAENKDNKNTNYLTKAQSFLNRGDAIGCINVLTSLPKLEYANRTSLVAYYLTFLNAYVYLANNNAVFTSGKNKVLEDSELEKSLHLPAEERVNFLTETLIKWVSYRAADDDEKKIPACDLHPLLLSLKGDHDALMNAVFERFRQLDLLKLREQESNDNIVLSIDAKAVQIVVQQADTLQKLEKILEKVKDAASSKIENCNKDVLYIEFTEKLHSQIATAYIKFDQPEVAEEYLKDGKSLTPRFYHMLLSVYVNQKNWAKIPPILKMAEGVLTPAQTLNLRIRSSVESKTGNNKSMALEALYREAKAQKLRFDEYAFYHLLRGFVATRDVPKAESLFQEMKASLSKENNNNNNGIGCPVYVLMFDLYFKTGFPQRSLQLFEEVKQQKKETHAIYAQLVRNLTYCKRWSDAISILNDMNAANLGDLEIHGLLVNKLHEHGMAAEALGLLHDRRPLYSKHTATKLPLAASSTMLIRSCGQLRQLQFAFGVYELYKQSNQHDLFMVNALIDACIVCGAAKKAIQLYDNMELEPDTISYNTIIRAYAMEKDLPAALQILHTMTAKNCAPTVVTYNTLVHTTVQLSQFKKAWDIVDEMQAAGIAPDCATYTSLISSIKHNPSGQQMEDLKRAFAAVQCMIEQHAKSYNKNDWSGDHEPPTTNTSSSTPTIDGVLIRALLDACAHLGRPDIAEQALSLTQSFFAIGVFEYGLLIKCYSAKRDLQSALKVKERIPKNALNAVIFGALIDLAIKTQNETKAEQLFQEMEEIGIEHSLISLSLKIKLYGRTQKPQKAMAVLKEIKDRGLEPGILTFNSVIDSVARAKALKTYITDILRMIQQEGIAPNACTYSIICRGYAQAGDLKMALQALSLQKTKNFPPDLPSYNSILDLLLQSKDPANIAKAEQIYHEIANPNPLTHSIMLKLYVQAGQTNKAEKFLSQVQNAKTNNNNWRHRNNYNNNYNYNNNNNGSWNNNNNHNQYLAGEYVQALSSNGYVAEALKYLQELQAECTTNPIQPVAFQNLLLAAAEQEQVSVVRELLRLVHALPQDFLLSQKTHFVLSKNEVISKELNEQLAAMKSRFTAPDTNEGSQGQNTTIGFGSGNYLNNKRRTNNNHNNNFHQNNRRHGKNSTHSFGGRMSSATSASFTTESKSLMSNSASWHNAAGATPAGTHHSAAGKWNNESNINGQTSALGKWHWEPAVPQTPPPYQDPQMTTPPGATNTTVVPQKGKVSENKEVDLSALTRSTEQPSSATTTSFKESSVSAAHSMHHYHPYHDHQYLQYYQTYGCYPGYENYYGHYHGFYPYHYSSMTPEGFYGHHPMSATSSSINHDTVVGAAGEQRVTPSTSGLVPPEPVHQ